MNPYQLFQALEQTAFATAIREGSLLFPWIESLHVLAIVSVVGSISIIDLRLLGVPAHRLGIQQLMREILPLTWIAFVIATLTGLMLFASGAVKYAALWIFQAKIALLVLAGLNMLVFHLLTWRTVEQWDAARQPPGTARLAGAISLALWVSVLVLGRWIGFAR